MKKILFLILGICAIVAAIYLWDKFSFPIKYKVCDIGYKNCRVVAKFKDRSDCETTKKFWNWLCDQTNPNNIKCKAESETEQIISGYCE